MKPIANTTEAKTEELQKEMGELDTKEKSVSDEKKAPKKKSSAKKKTSAKKVSAKKTNGASENLVTLKQLCKDVKLDPRVARRKLRNADLKADGRWSWEKGSSALKKVTDVLSAAE